MRIVALDKEGKQKQHFGEPFKEKSEQLFPV